VVAASVRRHGFPSSAPVAVWDHLPASALSPPRLTTNYGLGRPQLSAAQHLERQSRRGDDGYTIMDAYNRVLPATVDYRQPGGRNGGPER
jgi:hypothetical protein